jgi:hypothetical protein
MEAVEKRLDCGYGEFIFQSENTIVRYVSIGNAISEVCTTNYTLFFYQKYPIFIATTKAAFTVFKNNFLP